MKGMRLFTPWIVLVAAVAFAVFMFFARPTPAVQITAVVAIITEITVGVIVTVKTLRLGR